MGKEEGRGGRVKTPGSVSLFLGSMGDCYEISWTRVCTLHCLVLFVFLVSTKFVPGKGYISIDHSGGGSFLKYRYYQANVILSKIVIN